MLWIHVLCAQNKRNLSKVWCVLPQTDVRTPKEDGVRKRNFEDDHHLSFFPENSAITFVFTSRDDGRHPCCHRVSSQNDNKNDDSHCVGSEKPLSSVKKKQTFLSSRLSSLRNDDDR